MLRRPKRRKTEYIFFSGKGGVGKTSVAAATSLWLSRRGKKVLIISTDPAHSLSDSFETDIGGEVKKLRKNLYAVEIDPALAMQEYKEKFVPRIENIEYLKGFGLEDTFDIAGMTPGIDEIASFDKFLQYMGSGDYDVIVFDTAPTGHTLRFLSLPDVLDSWIGKMIKIRLRFASLANVFKKILPFGNTEEGGADAAAGQLDAMKKRIEKARKILSDPDKTHFWIVTIAEQMAVYESRRALKILKDYRIPVEGIIVNQLIPENDCSFCQARRKMQLENLKRIHGEFPGMKIKEINLLGHEIKGFRTLERVGSELYKD